MLASAFLLGLIAQSNMWGWLALITIIAYTFSLVVRLGFIHISVRQYIPSLELEPGSIEDTYFSSFLFRYLHLSLVINQTA